MASEWRSALRSLPLAADSRGFDPSVHSAVAMARWWMHGALQSYQNGHWAGVEEQRKAEVAERRRQRQLQRQQRAEQAALGGDAQQSDDSQQQR